MGRASVGAAVVVALLSMAAAAAWCVPARPRDVGGMEINMEFTDVGGSAGPDDPLLWSRHTNATIYEAGYDIIINGSILYAVGTYAPDGVDTGLLVTKWTTGGQHVWNSRLNQLTGFPFDGREIGREAWCNSSGDVFISGTGTALAKVNAAGTITSLNVSSYDRLSDLDVNGSYIIAGGGKEDGTYYPEDLGYLKKFTLDGQLVWQRVFNVTDDTDLRDVEVVGDQIVGIQEVWGGAADVAYLVTWNATGGVVSNTSLGSFQAEEMRRLGNEVYVVGHQSSTGKGFLVKAWLNGSIGWTRLLVGDPNFFIKDLVLLNDTILVCGYNKHQDARGAEGYVGKWSSAGVQLWNYTWDAPGNDFTEGIAADATGVYVTGTRPDTTADLLVMKLRPDGKVPVPAIGKNVTGSVLSGSSIQFTAGGTTGDGSATRFWDFGDGTNSTATNPVHAFAAGGMYNVTLNVTDVDGSIGVASVLVVVVQDVSPAASFVVSDQTPLTGSLVQFNYTGTPGNAPASFLWTFGVGGPTSTMQNATFTFMSGGACNVTLAVTDADGDVGRASAVVTVSQRPTEPPGGPGPEAIAGISAGVVAVGVVGLAMGARVVKKRRARAPPAH
jgi:PKD repeat protein